jgi:hypothetical protein
MNATTKQPNPPVTVTLTLSKVQLERIIYAVGQQRQHAMKVADYALDNNYKGTVVEHYVATVGRWTILRDELQQHWDSL